MKWEKKVKVKHLFTEEEDYDSVQKSMNAVADVLEKFRFPKGLLKQMRDIPTEHSLVVANSLLDGVYNYADRERIWIG